MNRKLRVGIIGCGRFAAPGHAIQYALNPRCEFAAVCDRDEERARSFAGKFRVPEYFSDAEKMLDSARLDAVSIATPTFTHAELTIAAAARGIHVLCEKPFSISEEEGRSMIDACASAGVRLHVGFHKRYDLGIALVREKIMSGEYGDCFHAELRWNGLSTMGNVPLFNRLVEAAGALGVSLEDFTPDWRFSDPRIPGGVLEVFCHVADLALWFFGAPNEIEGEAKTVASDARKPDHAAALLRYSNGPVVYLTMSPRSLTLKESECGRLNCTGGNLYYDTDSTRQTFFPARVTAETDGGLFGARRTLPPRISLNPLMNMPHYHKINNFLLDAAGELPDSERDFVATGEQALEVDKVIRTILR